MTVATDGGGDSGGTQQPSGDVPEPRRPRTVPYRYGSCCRTITRSSGRDCRTILARQGDLAVVGEAGTVAAARSVVADAAPDIVLLDVKLSTASDTGGSRSARN